MKTMPVDIYTMIDSCVTQSQIPRGVITVIVGSLSALGDDAVPISFRKGISWGRGRHPVTMRTNLGDFR